MLQSNPVPPEPPIENRCPECLFLKLEGNPIWTDLLNRDYRQIELHLTLNFHEEEVKLKWGSVWFGLKRGELRLRLTNARIPYDARNLNDLLTLLVSKDIKTQEGREHQSNLGGSLSAKEPSLKANATEKRTTSRTESFQETTWRVSTKGSEEEPTWVFETDDLFLKGTLPTELLATMDVTAKSCRVEATFEVSRRDVYFSRGEGIWLNHLSRNKQLVIENKLILWWLREKLTPYLSRVELHYD
ncbi:MAG: hypothetical protein SWY16_17210 [Cyanobacteriota bacterium]|nr:hypothetical protein [Cyanobacteriota bacterium]